jgi:hypothetical protein
MHFPTLDKARNGFSVMRKSKRPLRVHYLELQARVGTAVFELSSAQVNEAINAFKRLEKVNISLTEAVDFRSNTRDRKPG